MGRCDFASPSINNNKHIFSFIKQVLYLFQLRKLERIGFIKKSVALNNIYIFHDELAKMYKVSEYKRSRVFQSVFDIVISLRLSNEISQKNHLLSWLYSIEPAETNINAFRLFRQAQLSGNTGVMLNNLERIYEEEKLVVGNTDKKMLWIYRELAILLELTGNYESSIKFYRDCLTLTTDTQDVDIIYLDMLELNHGRIEGTYEEIKNNIILLKSKTKYYKKGVVDTGFRYWIVHTNIHLGVFSIEAMEAIASEIENDFEYLFKQDPYKTVQLLRRAYFDLLRLSYLQGGKNTKFYYDLLERPAFSLLEEYDSLFWGYYKKHFSAQYLQYNAIYRYFIFGDKPKKFVIEKITKSSSPPSFEIESFITFLESEYKQSSDLFLANSNKSGSSTYLRLVELEIMKVTPDSAKINSYLNQYSEYISKMKIPDFFGNLNTVKAKVRMNEYFSIKFSSNTGKVVDRNLEVIYDNAKNLLAKAELSYSENRNTYGIFRVNFLSAILLFLASFDVEGFKDNTNNLMTEAKQNHFYRELDIINFISTSESVRLNYICNLIKFYPVVIQ